MKKILISTLFITLISFALSTLINSNKTTNKEQTETFKMSKDSKTLEIQQRGCCSWHGGVYGCSGGRVVCSDGSLSPSCTCNSDINPLNGC